MSDAIPRAKPSLTNEESRSQMSPSPTHFVSHVAPSVATMMFFTMPNIGNDIASATSTGTTMDMKRYM